jgi:SAM-dependent methyltransferase
MVNDSPMLYASLLAYIGKPRELLDLGCGTGPLLRLCRENGIKARGVDSDQEAVRICRERGLEAEVGDLFSVLDGMEPGAGPEAIALCHVVEHFPVESVRRIFQAARRALPEEGRLAVVTPNSKNLGIICDSFWRDLGHVRPYPRQVLGQLGQEAGLTVLTAGVDLAASPRGLSRLVNFLRRWLVGDYFSGPDAYVVFLKPGS